MCKKLLCLVCLVLLSGQVEWALGADPNLVGLWRLDEGEGTVARDSSGNGNDGVFNGDPQWVEGYYGSALEFDGAGDFLDCGSDTSLDLTKWTIAFWLNLNENKNYNAYVVKGMDAAENYEVLTYGVGNFHFPILFEGGARGFSNTANGVSIVGEWAHYAYTYDPTQGRRFYKDGNLIFEDTESRIPQASTASLLIGNEGGQSRFVPGIMDDIGIFDYAMTVDEIQQIMQGFTPAEIAVNVYPENEQIDVPRDSALTWGSGKYAVTHDVYFGTSLEDVNNASTADGLGVLVSEGQTENTYDPGRLEFDQVYYWRVDEVNGAPDRTVFKGQVWSFTAEPYAIPVEMISATASSSNAANMGPENTIGGVGLNAQDQHSTEGTEMWLSGMGDPSPTIQYDFDQAYKLHEMWVWNSNQLIESFVGIGAKDVVVEYSLNGTDWTVLAGATQFNQAPGNATYTANTMVDFGGALARFVKITINAGYGMLPQYGISEVRFYYIPTFAREPMPADGDTTAGANVELSWRAGREAASHEVYLGTDAENLPLVATVTDNSYTADGLLFDTAYTWQIVEVNDSETPAAYAGPVWGFNTPSHGTVDNMDGYDDNCNRIFFAWEDGLGHNGGEDIEGCNVPPSNGNGGGSIVGNNVAPFAEQTIVYAGRQSLPFSYDNAFGDSYATLTLEGQDWTASGIQSLSIMFYGTAGNTGELYVKINNSKVSYADDAANIARAEWQAWVVDLAQVGGNLQNVTSLTIGVDGAGASGMLYFDEIGLYPGAAEYVTPVDPGNASLAGHWTFDEGAGDVAADTSGNGNNGTLVGAGWETGQMGSAVVFDGLSAYVDVPATAWNTVEQQVTVTAWMYVDSSITQNPFTMAAFQDPSNGQTRVFSNHVLWGGTLYLDTGGDTSGYDRISKAASASDYADAWIHWAFTKNAETGEQKIYRNGILWHSGTGLTRTMTGVTVFILGANAPATGEYWNGSMDDLRIYNTELSQEEILWVAGRTSPVAKPF